MSATGDRWAHVERLYHEALEQEPAARAAFLEAACAGNAELRGEIESLLGFDVAASRFLTRSAIENVAARLPQTRPGALIGRQIHGYDIRELLGAGGMGDVYRATDLRLGRDVALKILRRTGQTNANDVRRFEDEARSASVLNHPNIVTIYGVGEDNDVSYIAMECVAGRTLGEVIAEGKLSTAAALDLAVQLADALAVAHDKGIIHRDLKPDNVMVTADGRLKVLDFGIAKREGAVDGPLSDVDGPAVSGTMTEAGQILGTVGYMSPEQAEGLRATAASDRFSFGAILYELVSGRRAFNRPTRTATLEAIKREEPEPFAIQSTTARRPLRRVLERCLAKDPAARYANTQELVVHLRDLRDRVAGQSLSRRQVIWLGAGSAAAVAAAGVLGWQFWPRGPRVRALALLPFENANNDAGLDYLSNGLTDALILRIGVLQIRVMPHSLVSNFRRSGLDARSFARSIGADSYLIGSVVRRAGELTIAATLVDVATGKQLWSNSFTRPDGDVQAAQDAIATAIVDDGINLQLSDSERDWLVRRVTNNAGAYEEYMKAILGHEKQTFADLRRTREHLTRALELDPTFARAYAAIAGVYATAAIDGFEAPKECWPLSQANVRQAHRRDPELPDGYAADALRELFFNWNWRAAEEGWRQALRVRGAEMYPPLRLGKALLEFALGRTDEAVRTMAEVRRIDKLSPVLEFKEATYLREDGQLDKAAAGYESAIRAMPNLLDAWWGLVDVRCAQREFDKAIELCRQLVAGGGYPDLDRAFVNARGESGYRRIEREIARHRLMEFDIREGGGHYIAPIDRARNWLLAGDTTRALAYLDKAFEAYDPGVVMLKMDRVWAPLRGQPKFEAAVKKVGLP